MFKFSCWFLGCSFVSVDNSEKERAVCRARNMEVKNIVLLL
jgi:hypothetical protein